MTEREDADITVALLAARFDDEWPDSAAEWVAERAVRSIRATERTRLLVDLLAYRIEGRRRAKARAIEQAATRAAENEARAEQWLAERVERRAYEAANPRHAPRNSRVYKDWVANTEAGKKHDAWTSAQREVDAERQRLRAEDPEAYDQQYGAGAVWRAFNERLEEIRQEARLELTVQLLGSSFSLGDGHVTTWGAATAEQHEQRIGVLMSGIEGTAQTAALHAKAIELLAERNARCLNDVRFAA